MGTAGVATIIATYGALQLGRLDGRGLAYSSLNAVGAACVLVSLTVDFNLSAVLIEVFWIAISLVGVVRGLRERLRPPAETPREG